MASAFASALFFCLILLPQFGTSYHTSYSTHGSRKFILRSSDQSRALSTKPVTCSPILSGLSNGKLPLVHRLSPCSPLKGEGKSSNPLPADVHRRDVHRIRSLFAARSGVSEPPTSATAPAPAPAADTVPVHGIASATLPGAQDYTVLVGYGTPAQQFPVALDTSLGISLLGCKPCLPPSAVCEPAFDPTRSSTFTNVPCGSADCRSNCSGSGTCQLSIPGVEVTGSIVRDVLTLTPAAAGVHGFTFGCLQVDGPSLRPVVGALDLSRDSRSLASRLSSPGTPAFSYCLPLFRNVNGFLSIGASRPETAKRPGERVSHTPLVQNPAFPNIYFVDLVGMTLKGIDLQIPPAAFAANGTALDVVSSFTFLPPAAYAMLRDAFRREMSQYPMTAPVARGLDTCYNFTGLTEFEYPLARLKFGNGESLLVGEGMLYYEDPSAGPASVACLAFAPLPFNSPYAVIGTLAQITTEVVYDVSGGRVGFIQDRC